MFELFPIPQIEISKLILLKQILISSLQNVYFTSEQKDLVFIYDFKCFVFVIPTLVNINAFLSKEINLSGIVISCIKICVTFKILDGIVFAIPYINDKIEIIEEISMRK